MGQWWLPTDFYKGRKKMELRMEREIVSSSEVLERARVKEQKRIQTAMTRFKNKIESAVVGARELLTSGRLVNTGHQICVRTLDGLREYAEGIKVNGEYCLDIETTGLDPFSYKIVGICLYTPSKSEKRIYVPMNHTDLDNVRLTNQLSEEQVWSVMGEIFDGDYKFINHMTKFDGKGIKVHYGNMIKNFYWDTWVGAKLLNENEPNHELKSLYAKYVSKVAGDGSSYADLFGKEVPFNYMPIDVATIYGADDAFKAYKLYEFQKKHMTKGTPDMNKIYHVFKDIEMPLVPVVAQMELNGVGCDTEYADELERQFRFDIEEVKEKLDTFVAGYSEKIKDNAELSRLAVTKDGQVNLLYSSPLQLAGFIYDVLGSPITDRRKPRGTGEEILLKLKDKTKMYKSFFDNLLKYRELSKLLNTYIAKLPKEVNPLTNRIHGSFNQYGAVTGRFSSSEPNLQNIPSHEKRVRKIFKADEGKVFISGDYSQVEPRVLACVSEEDNMKESYRQGRDLYADMASFIFNKPVEQCGDKTPERNATKAVLLGIMYERTPESIALEFGKPMAWGIRVVADFYNGFPNIKLFKMKAIYQAETMGYVTTVDGRKRRLPDMKLDREGNKYQVAFRQVVNSIIQGTSADITKRAMILVGTDKRLQELDCKLLMTVHDELICEVPKCYAKESANRIRDLMLQAGQAVLDIPMKVDLEIMERWYGEDLSNIFL